MSGRGGRPRGDRQGAGVDRSGGRSTVLFIDEIHRFNKAQQDALLPQVEDGTITLIGATTENPYFEVNSALLSRMRVFRLEPLTDEQVGEIVDRAHSPMSGARRRRVTLDDDALEHLVAISGGDARAALNVLEAAAAMRVSTSPAGRARRRRSRRSRTPRSSASSPTTAQATATTARSARSSRACAATTPTRRCTGWRPWSRRARIPSSWRGACHQRVRGRRQRRSRALCSSPSQRRTRSTGSACPKPSTPWHRRRRTSPRRPSRTGSGRPTGRRWTTSWRTAHSRSRPTCAAPR